jgi:hypothetical protein
MKARALITISLLLNAGLLAAVTWFATRPSQTPAAPDIITRVVTQVVPEAVPAPAPAPEKPAAPAPVERFDWRQVESPDYKEYIARLRGIGCPEQTIRDIIIADVSKLYAEKRAALYNAPKVVRYWQSSDTQYTRDNVKYQQAVRALEKEKHDLIRELLGVELRRELAKIYGGEPDFDRSLMFLTPERREPVQALLDKYRDLERAVYAEADGEPNEAQRARLDALRKERESALAAMLSPDELKEYELTNSRIARDIRGNLNGFDASEQEFLAVYEARKAVFDQLGERGRNEDEATRNARRAAEQEMESQIAATLGAERYAEFKRSQSGDYEELYELTRRYDLPRDAAVAVYDIKQLAEAHRRNIEQNTALPPDQRAALLKELAVTTKQAAEAALGKDAYNYYQRRDGRWMDRLGQAPQQKKGG